jgi:hypothetical protein
MAPDGHACFSPIMKHETGALRSSQCRGDAEKQRIAQGAQLVNRTLCVPPPDQALRGAVEDSVRPAVCGAGRTEDIYPARDPASCHRPRYLRTAPDSFRRFSSRQLFGFPQPRREPSSRMITALRGAVKKFRPSGGMGRRTDGKCLRGRGSAQLPPAAHVRTAPVSVRFFTRR